jgi:predicted lipid-binding transport protein (Tim44 family)
MRRHPTLIAAALAGCVVLALTADGCTASNKGSASTAALDNAAPAGSAAGGAAAAVDGAVDSAPSPAAPPNSAPAAAGAGSAGRAAPADQPLLAGRDVIYTADITVRATSIDSAVSQVETLADTYGGVVYAEQVDLRPKDPDNPGTASATITLKVPPENLQKTLDAIGKVGTEVNRTQNSDDVTEKVVDVNARIDAARASIARLTDLLAHQGTVADLLNVESQLSQRDSDLESLEQQQKSLAAQTKSATITAHLQAAPPVITATKTKQTHTFGFVRGLRGGWHAFTKTVAAIATGVGAVLPFLILLAVLGIAVIIGRRKLRGRRPQES